MGGFLLKKYIVVLFMLMIILPQKTLAEEDIVTYIIEVEGNPSVHASSIERQYPSLEVVETFTILLQALAVKGKPEDINELLTESFVKNVYDVQTYAAKEHMTNIASAPETAIFPHALNNTDFTGKGVKVGVVDTGIDLKHPDLRDNIKGGYDVVDFKKDPQETEGQGATNHGSHVAGIIAANGKLTGVAPDTDIYAYRALGPGGFGTSVHVIAAMEKAIQDGVDIMNLSLGNVINGPDYPTSKAVNEATKQGVILVVANGNDGPADWTVGAPATAAGAVSVGAYQNKTASSYLYHPLEKKKVKIKPFTQHAYWLQEKTYPITSEIADGKMYIMREEDKEDESIWDLVNEEASALLIPTDIFDESILEKVGQTNIPIAMIPSKDVEKLREDELYQLKVEEKEETLASFSSRGPVTINWEMKPDIIAPGVNILSTVPGGYDMLNGTSMAAPHVAGALAVMKEARPTWTNEQMVHALQTTATKLEDRKPTEQGAGLLDIEQAIDTTTIIHDPSLAFGKFTKEMKEKTVELTIENIGTEAATYRLQAPKKIPGLSWTLPNNVTIEPGRKKTIAFNLKIDPLILRTGIHEGYLRMASDKANFDIAYVFLHETANYPRVMGTQFQVKSLQNNEFSYEMYLTDEVEEVKVNFLDTKTLTINDTILLQGNFTLGMNEGTFEKQQSDNEIALLTIRFTNGEITQMYVDI